MVAENRVEAAGVARRELKKASERLLLPHDVTDEATCIYKRSLETGLAKGRPLHCANRQLPVANVRSHTIVFVRSPRNRRTSTRLRQRSHW